MSYLDTLYGYHDEKAKEKSPHSTEVLGLLTAAKMWVNAWPAQNVGTDVLRASQVYGLCPREFVLNYWQPRPLRSFDWSSQFMMNMGTYLHHYIQNSILGPMGILKGTWANYDSSIIRTGYHPDPEQVLSNIADQKAPMFTYIEPCVWLNEQRISGHCDGVVSLNRIQWLLTHSDLVEKDICKAAKEVSDIDPGEEALLEIKTSGSHVYKSLEGSDSIADYYKQQACIYQAGMKIYKTVFWYLNRDTMRSKSMIYHFEDSWWTDAKRKARIIWQSIRDETLPDVFMACRLPTDDRAKKCACKEPCWAKRLNFERYVADGKKLAEASGRKLLNLSTMEFDTDHLV